MARARLKGLETEYEAFGRPADPALLLIAGLGSQLTWWPTEFCAQLAECGYRVVRFDNRDCGLTVNVGPVPPRVRVAGVRRPPYLMPDLAEDAVGLLDALEIEAAHVVGASMGAMIAQQLTIDHPSRVLSLCSIMSRPGDRASGRTQPKVDEFLMNRPGEGRERVVDAGVAFGEIIASPDHPMDPAERRAEVAAAYDRAYRPDGLLRQLSAIYGSPDRTEGLRSVAVPTLVVHGEQDPLVNADGGRATAAAVPGARLWLVPGMGHDLPRPLWPALVAAITANAAARRQD
ncbi:pimeloyl-ACP methyl ester carboxylesterase [Kitasatospora sp. MAA4]|uniref:alpha/beta fold hydrolase n=1 Tax=Kitasatospora sp. MAA4 TaxID=3035093 RepID=UPI0024765A0C|nr:alpha/beta hydrolase [Kitasatospora sp. MAA4]MDH6132082.1 pimeloyl-ACP methyl ester carboxylesterase [Kitasatospora sp. MAA4]